MISKSRLENVYVKFKQGKEQKGTLLSLIYLLNTMTSMPLIFSLIRQICEPF